MTLYYVTLSIHSDYRPDLGLWGVSDLWRILAQASGVCAPVLAESSPVEDYHTRNAAQLAAQVPSTRLQGSAGRTGEVHETASGKVRLRVFFATRACFQDLV